MFKNIFLLWITIQLTFIGLALVDIENKIILKTYKCPESEIISPIFGMIFPLSAFIPENKEIEEYCK